MSNRFRGWTAQSTGGGFAPLINSWRPVGAAFWPGEYADHDYPVLMEEAIRSGHDAAAGVSSVLEGQRR